MLMTKQERHRIVVIGLSDAGLLTAIRLSKRKHEIIAISSTPCFLDGEQQLGRRRLSEQPSAGDDVTKQQQPPPPRRSSVGTRRGSLGTRFRNNINNVSHLDVDGIRIIHGRVVSVDTGEQRVTVADPRGTAQHDVDYDALLVATGTTHGFWRTGEAESLAEINAGLERNAATLRGTRTIAVVGGGPSAVETACGLRERHGEVAEVHLFFPELLPGYATAARNHVAGILEEKGVVMHPDHRADTSGVDVSAIGTGRIRWKRRSSKHFSAGERPPPPPPLQEPFAADRIVWAVGTARPNTEFLPRELRDESGYVVVTPALHHPEHPDIFAVGDVCGAGNNRPHQWRTDGGGTAAAIAATNIDRYLRNTRKPRALRKSLKPFRVRASSFSSSSVNDYDGDDSLSSSSSRATVVLKRWLVEKVLDPVLVRASIYEKSPASVQSVETIRFSGDAL